jgi:hypothetical protein
MSAAKGKKSGTPAPIQLTAGTHSPGPYAAVGPFMLVSKANLGAHIETIATFNGDRKEANRQRVLTLLRLLNDVPTELLEHPGLRLYWVLDDVVVGETEAMVYEDARKKAAADVAAEVTALRVIAEALVAWGDGVDHPLLDMEAFGVRQLHRLVTEARATNKKPEDKRNDVSPGEGQS